MQAQKKNFKEIQSHCFVLFILNKIAKEGKQNSHLNNSIYINDVVSFWT